MTRKPVSFHDAPPSEESASRYQKAIADAKKVVKPKPQVAATPRFDQQDSSSWQQKNPQRAQEFLSQDTKEQIKKLAELSEQQPAPEQVEESEPEEQTEVQEEQTPEEKLRSAIEARTSKLDIGQYIMSGVATQSVSIIPGKLEVVFKTITDAEESYVDKALSIDKDITSRQFVRKNNEFALATHIHSVNGHKWPNHVDSSEEIDPEVMEVRLRHVKKLSSPIFNLLVDNLNWFLQRVHEELTFEVLGNG